ncbi:MAG: mechanosensitive ion channel family protein [Paenibacillaceae bacterium]
MLLAYISAITVNLKLSDMWDKFIVYLSDPDRWIDYSNIALKIVLIITIAKIASKLLNKTIRRIAEEKDRLKFNPRRTTTIMRLMGNIANYAISFIMVMMILAVFKVPFGPMLAGAGVVGLAIGFGAQSLVKDIITGFFIIFEDQFAVGDVIQTGSFKGTVEEIGLRVTRIKNWTGEIHIIPNGSIVEVTNFSVNNSIAVVDISVAYEMNIEKAIAIIQETVNEISLHNENILKEPEVLGVQSLAASEVIIRVICECKANQQYSVARQMNAEIKKSFDANGIEIPYPRIVSYQRIEKAE